MRSWFFCMIWNVLLSIVAKWESVKVVIVAARGLLLINASSPKMPPLWRSPTSWKVLLPSPWCWLVLAPAPLALLYLSGVSLFSSFLSASSRTSISESELSSLRPPDALNWAGSTAGGKSAVAVLPAKSPEFSRPSLIAELGFFQRLRAWPSLLVLARFVDKPGYDGEYKTEPRSRSKMSELSPLVVPPLGEFTLPIFVNFLTLSNDFRLEYTSSAFSSLFDGLPGDSNIFPLLSLLLLEFEIPLELSLLSRLILSFGFPWNCCSEGWPCRWEDFYGWLSSGSTTDFPLCKSAENGKSAASGYSLVVLRFRAFLGIAMLTDPWMMK